MSTQPPKPHIESISQYQSAMARLNTDPDPLLALSRLNLNAAFLVDDTIAHGRPRPQDEPQITQERLGAILQHMTEFAISQGIDLEEAARRYISNHTLTGPPTTEHPLYDEVFSTTQQLPRIMQVQVTSQTPEKALTTINGQPFGDPLRDNRHDQDGYRYHDVFHIAHATFLGWSPTLRGLLRRKRKSNPTTDEVEDGGRAIAIEEGLTALIFHHAEDNSFYDGHDTVDRRLLRTLQRTTAHLEVANRTSADWQRAILEGYRVWRHINTHQGGELTADLINQIITIH